MMLSPRRSPHSICNASSWSVWVLAGARLVELAKVAQPAQRSVKPSWVWEMEYREAIPWEQPDVDDYEFNIPF